MNAKLLAALVPFAIQAQLQPIDGFLDNKLSDIAIHGQRVVVRSADGISWVDSLSKPLLQWKSIKDLPSHALDVQINRDYILLNDSSVIVTLPSENKQYKWLAGNFKTNEFSVQTFTPATSLPAMDLDGYSGSERQGRFYLPIYDGGILVLESGEPKGIMIPDSATLFPVTYTYATAIPEANRPLQVTTTDSTMTVLTEQNLFVWNFIDQKWSKRALPAKHLWSGITPIPGTVLISGKDSVTTLNNHYRNDSLFSKLYENENSAMRYGNDILYIVKNGTVLARNAQTGKEIDSINEFTQRIQIADGFAGNGEVLDCGYSVSGSDTLFVIASNKGFLYSLNAHEDERNGTPFTYVRRDKAVAAGLSETYAIPFIINENSPAVISYNLSESAKVTIDILDYNLDFVCRIVDSEPRDPGAKSSTGLSTNRSRDRWDGSLSGTGGSTAAAGVYYYRITTDKGERGFGKIILAKN